MIRLEWNALRAGDRVAVHDDATPNLDLVEGVVKFVQTALRNNDLAIRLDGVGAERSVVHPTRHAVHTLPIERGECWRCSALPPKRPPGRAMPRANMRRAGTR